ncbi:MAG: S1 RNA-binding domain-containing protein [Caldilinea sp.]|nr:S1 RNA-binding domain-containing protein [Caldilinea sp.]MDW8439749.1 S1 RNA-binding domain-containing protein [Caldilineaceae bacterium]
MSEQELIRTEEVSAPTPEGETNLPAAPEPTVETSSGAAVAHSSGESPQTTTHVAQSDAATPEEGRRVVKLLREGQQIQGKVKRITEFGAFVDIGVGRDGLIHISELSTTRVAKVTDVLREGQEVTLWIKKLDRERNRISLTMIEPGKRTIRDLQVGEVLEGTVTRLLPYGAFVDIGVGRDALLHVREMADGFVAKPEDVVKVGDTIEVRILEIARRRNRIDLTLKGLRPEPEPPAPVAEEQTVQPEPAVVEEPEEQFEDKFAHLEGLTTMQLAFLRAQERSGVTLLGTPKNKKQKRSQAAKKRAVQDEIIQRTLSTQQGKK